jgi:hypothetical protein
VSVVVLHLVGLLVEEVDVVVETVVLLLGLDERRHYLLDVLDPRRVLYLVERVFNDLGVAHVLVEQLLLFLVGLDDLGEAELEDGDGVGELGLLAAGAALGVVDRLVEALVVELDRLVPLLKPLLELLNLQFKSLLLFFVLCLQSQDLVIGLLSLF